MSDSIVIVGGGLGASRLAENLRGNGVTAPIVILSAEQHLPYDRPPLSKSVLTSDDAQTDLKPAEFYDEQQIEVRLGASVVAVDPPSHTVTLDGPDAETVAYGTLVLATGLQARTFPGEGGDLAGVHVIRAFEDAVALRDELPSVTRAVVIGAGFIGCEAAASLAKRGLDVTIVEPAETALFAALGPTIGKVVERLHVEAGVTLRTGIGVARLLADDATPGRVSGVELSDGSVLPADVVVVGIGGFPNLDYLDGSGIALADRSTGGGIACDHLGRASAPDVFAIGDAANWADAQGNRHRVEHWNHTVEQAVTVAAEIEKHPLPPPSVPYFWSDQYDLKVQMLGAPRADDDVHLVDDDGRKFLAYYSRDGILTGVVGAGRVGKLMKMRPHLLTPTPIADLLP